MRVKIRLQTETRSVDGENLQRFAINLFANPNYRQLMSFLVGYQFITVLRDPVDKRMKHSSGSRVFCEYENLYCLLFLAWMQRSKVSDCSRHPH